MAAEYIKTGVQVMYKVRDFHILHNVIRNAGLHEVGNDQGAYAILIYETFPPSISGDGEVVGNIILNTRSCAIYQAGPHDGMVYQGNIIRGQTDTVNGTLPKGGMCLNGGNNQVITANEITGCAADGIYWAQPNAGAPLDARTLLSMNTIGNCNRGIVIQSAAADASNISISANTITECASGIYVDLYTSATLGKLSIKGNSILSALTNSFGIRFVSPDATYKLKDGIISGNSIKVTKLAIQAASLASGVISISDNDIYGPVSERGIAINSSKVVVGINRFYDFAVSDGGGHCWFTTEAQGAFEPGQFRGCTTAALLLVMGADDLGRSPPTWTPAGGNVRVGNILSSELGTTPNKYRIAGWYYDGSAWTGEYIKTEAP